MKCQLFVFACCAIALLRPLGAQERDIQLNVAVFAFLPDASAAIEKLEEAFEARYAAIDLDIELINPYDDEIESDGLSQLTDFDIVEIDACRIDQLIQGALGGIDELPPDLLRPAKNFIGPAKILRGQEAGKYVVPHWVCGNFLVTRPSNKAICEAQTFKQLLTALNPAEGRPLLAPMWGRTTLGEFYADAVLDAQGSDKAREHLQKLSRGGEQLDAYAKQAILDLANCLPADQRGELEHYNNHSYVLPRLFAVTPQATLLGYSERLYFVERELQLKPKTALPIVKKDDLVLREFPFAEKSQGTPCWVDGFVIPKGKLAKKQAAISAFLLYIQSPEAFRQFAQPSPDLAASNLLPAVATAYEDQELLKMQPLLEDYRQVLGDGFLISDSATWLGMREAGKQLRGFLKLEKPK